MITEEGLRLWLMWSSGGAPWSEWSSPAVAFHRQQAGLAQQVGGVAVTTRRDRAVVEEHDLRTARHRAVAGHVHRRRLQLRHEDVVLPCCLEVLVQPPPVGQAKAGP